MITVGSDFSGVGAFNQALKRLNIEYKEIFACDMDKYARQTFLHNYGEPLYYPNNVYNREIPNQSLDIYMTSPPCQAFSLAGKRLGKEDKRGILFFNSHEFIKVNKPRFFIFENVKGLLSDDNGKTFKEWLNMLGGKSINGNAVLFRYEEAVDYHIYWKVLNAKDYGIPQNRERVFIVGIRDDKDNFFNFPAEEFLTKRLKDILEENVEEKYFLSEKAVKHLEIYKERHDKKGTGFGVELKDENSVASTLRANGALCPTDNHLKINSDIHNCIKEAIGRQGSSSEYIDSLKKVNEALKEKRQQGVISYTRDSKGKVISRHINQQANTIHSATGGGGNTDQFYTDGYKIRRLTPRECFRLMDFPDNFSWNVSDSQAYKQAGNSICVGVLAKIINNLKLF
jgi:DNA (cytosine-5)-methyltransferase 1